MFTQGGVGIVQHFGDFICGRDAAALKRDAAAFFEGQRVDGDVVRAHGEHLVEAAAEALGRVLGKTGDEVHVDVGEACRHHLAHGAADVVRRVAAADGGEDAVLHRLGVDGNAGDAVCAEDGELFGVDGVGAARLDGGLRKGGEIEAPLEPCEQTVHLLRRERGRRAAAHVEGLDMQAEGADHRARLLDLVEKGGEVGLDEGEGLLHALRDEAAVGAAGRAERDADVERDVVRLEVVLHAKSRFGGLEREAGAPRRDGVDLLKLGEDGGGRLALTQKRHGDLARAHAGETAPCGGDAKDLLRRAEEAQAQREAALPFLFVVRAGEGIAVAVGGGFAAAAQLSGDADAVRVLGQRDARRARVLVRDGAVDGPLVGEEGEQALLDRVFFIMPNELELHKGVRSFLS